MNRDTTRTTWTTALESKTEVPHFLSVTSGKGGVGKTCLAANLALALKNLSIDVLLVDFDLGLANIDVLFGIDPKKSIGDYLDGSCSLDECIVEGPRNLPILPATSGLPEATDLGEETLEHLFSGIRTLENPPEAVILDTAAGISRNVLSSIRSSDETILVTTPDPTALTDAYATLKVLAKADEAPPPTHLVINQVRTMEEAYRTSGKLIAAAKRFLNVEIEFLGWIPTDTAVTEAGLHQKSFLLESSGCAAARSTRFIASKLATHVRALRRKHGTYRS